MNHVSGYSPDFRFRTSGLIKSWKEYTRQICLRPLYDFSDKHDTVYAELDIYFIDRFHIEEVVGENYKCICWFTEEELEKHVNEARKFIDFEYSIINKERIEEYVTKASISIKVSSPSKLRKKYLYTWIKYSFEYPFNFWILDVWELKKQGSEETIENLILDVFMRYRGWNWNHTVPSIYTKEKLSTEELNNRLNNSTSLNSIYPRAEDMFMYPAIKDIGLPTAKWFNEESMNYRLQKYV